MGQPEFLHLLLVLGEIFSPTFLLPSAAFARFVNFGAEFLPSLNLIPARANAITQRAAERGEALRRTHSLALVVGRRLLDAQLVLHADGGVVCLHAQRLHARSRLRQLQLD